MALYVILHEVVSLDDAAESGKIAQARYQNESHSQQGQIRCDFTQCSFFKAQSIA
jgi:hypothetical protein